MMLHYTVSYRGHLSFSSALYANINVKEIQNLNSTEYFWCFVTKDLCFSLDKNLPSLAVCFIRFLIRSLSCQISKFLAKCCCKFFMTVVMDTVQCCELYLCVWLSFIKYADVLIFQGWCSIPTSLWWSIWSTSTWSSSSILG